MKKSKEPIYVYTLGIGATAKGVGNIGSFGLVSLTKMKNAGKIGSNVDEKNVEGPTTRLLFATAASVDALIAELKATARKMRAFDKSMINAAKKGRTKPLEIIINAAAYSSHRRLDQQRKLSRKRTK